MHKHYEQDGIAALIRKMKDVLKSTSQSEKPLILAYIFVISRKLSREDIEHLLSLEDPEKRTHSLEDSLNGAGYPALFSQQLSHSLRNLSTGQLFTLFQAVFECELPNPDVAEALIDAMQAMKAGVLPIEIASLCVKLANVDRAPSGHALCTGAIADRIALHSAKNLPTTYELRGIGTGSSIKQVLFDITRLNLQFDYQPTPQYKFFDEAHYQVGYIADLFGKTFTEDYTTGIDNLFRVTFSEVQNLEKMIKRVTGRIICLVSPLWLQKTSGEDAGFKHYLIEKGVIESVIQLPDKIFSSTTIAPSILVVNTEHTQNKVKFIDASSNKFYGTEDRSKRTFTGINNVLELFSSEEDSEFCVCTMNKYVLISKSNLSPKRYVKSESQIRSEILLNDYDVCKLGDIADIVRCQVIRPEPNSDVAGNEEHKEITELSPANIDENGQLIESTKLKIYTPSREDMKRVLKQTLHKEDIIFSIKGSIGKCAIIPDMDSQHIANQSFVIMRLPPNSSITSPIVLFRFLTSDIGKDFIKHRTSGASVPVIKMEDLKELPVPIPTIKQQLKILENHRKVEDFIKQKQAIENEIDKSLAEYWSL